MNLLVAIIDELLKHNLWILANLKWAFFNSKKSNLFHYYLFAIRIA